MLPVGTALGPYRILAPLGVGGMGEVYRARDTRLGRDVALKVIPADLAGDPDRIRRFAQEARAAGALNHPNVCATFDFGTHDGSPFVVMELLEGESLRARLNDGAVPLRKALDWAAQAARGLAAAHEKGIVHRDLKPENLFLTADGRIKVLDFGLAKLTRPENISAPGDASASIPPTGTGGILGTTGYMAPEQVRGERVDHRADLFALGSVLYELLTGQRAFTAETWVETSYRILTAEPAPPGAPGRDLPAGLEALLRRCLEKSPQERFQSALDLAFALESLAGGAATAAAAAAAPARSRAPTGTGSRIAYLAAGLLAGVLLAAAVASLVPRQPASAPPTFRKLSFGKGRINSACFTPDGNSVIYAAVWEDGEPELFSTRVDAPGSSPLGLSPAAIIGIRGGEAAVGIQGARGAMIATIPLSGGAPRPVFEGVYAADWSPDGRRFAVVRTMTGQSCLEYPPGRRLFATAGLIDGPRVSPRGDRVAFVHWPYRGSMSGAIMVTDTLGRVEILSGGWAVVATPCWSPDGAEVWFTAGRIWGWRALRAVTLDKRVRTVLEGPTSLGLLDIFRDGRVLLSSETQTSEIWGRAPGDSTERAYSWFDGSVATGLSADGASLLFNEVSVGGGLRQSIFLRRLDGGSPLRLGEGKAHGISADGAWVLKDVDSLLTLMPTGAGASRPLPAGAVVLRQAAAFCPDGKRIVIGGSEAGRPSRLFVQELAGGPPRPISPEGVLMPSGGACISPDGSLIAAVREGEAVLVPVVGGTPQPIEGLLRGEVPVAWTRDGRSLFVEESRRVGVLRVIRFDLATRVRTLWKEIRLRDPAGGRITYHPLIARDGAVYFYTAARTRGDLFVVAGLR